MRNPILLLFLVFSFQTFGQRYEKDWGKVTALEAKGQLKSANEAVTKIFRKANRRKEDTEIVKAFLFQSKYSLVLEEESQRNFFRNLNEILPKTNKETQAILHFIYAKSLADYYRSNSYFIEQRTDTDTLAENDFKTWPKNIFLQTITQHFEQSLADENLLQNTPLSNYEALITKNQNFNHNTRTLFDFLASQYIRYVTTSDDFYRNGKTSPNDAVTEFHKKLASETPVFLATNTDSLSKAPKKIFSLYQKIEKHYQQTNTLFWLENTMLERLSFIFNEFFNEDNDFEALQIVSLENCVTNFKERYCNNEAKLLLAEQYQQNAAKITHPDYYKKALCLTDDVLSNPIGNQTNRAKKIQFSITAKSLSVTQNQTVLPNRINRALLQYRNLDKVYGSIYKFDNDFKDFDDYYEPKTDSLIVDVLKKKKPVLQFERTLPKQDGYFFSSTEILIPELKNGTYLIVFRGDTNELTYESPIGHTEVRVTNLAAESFVDLEARQHVQVFDRTTGKPIQNAEVIFSSFKAKTDADGKVVYQLNNENHQSQINFKCVYEKDTLYQHNAYNYYAHLRKNRKLKKAGQVSILTDRSIYRPGQKVYFKAIAVYRDEEEKIKVIADRELKIEIRNTNSEKIQEFSLKTNEFGSVSGEFVLPKNGLAGNYTIQVVNNPFQPENYYERYHADLAYFNVEEYKRPKFEITFSPVTSSYSVNQNITVKGNAKALTGSNISEAKVVYRVVRNTQYARYFYYDYNNDKEQVAQGETTTDGQGNFTITFIAKPNDKSDKKSLPVFTYTLYADITDSSGETRSNQTQVNVGYHSLKINAQLPATVKTTDKPEIIISTVNLNNNFVPASGEIKIYKIQAPDRVLTKRAFNKPEIQTIPKETYIKLFPFEPYEDEDNKNNWKKDAIRFSVIVNTKNNTKIKLPVLQNWKPGAYELVFTAKDTLGNEVESSSKFNVLNDAAAYLADNQLFHHEIVNKNPKADGYVLLKMKTAADRIYVNTDAYYQNTIYHSNTTAITKGTAVVKIPVDPSFEKTINLQMRIILDNTLTTFKATVPLHKETEDLEFETLVLRNKMEPGQKETWSFTVKPKNKKPVPAEILATMYDTSLDQFRKAYWQLSLIPEEYPYYHSYRKTVSPFYTRTFDIRKLNPRQSFRISNITKDQFNWFGFNINDYRYRLPGNANNIIQKDKIKPKPKKGSKFTVQGVVMEGGLPLPGVSVVIKGTTLGTQSDMDGKYSLKVSYKDDLVFSFIGMTDVIAKISEYATININMTAEAAMLEDVVVSALGIKKDAITSSYAVVKDNINDEVQPLVGQVSGLQISSSNDKVVLRGNRSLEGNFDALIIIDGAISDLKTFQRLNQEIILSVEVLKGAQGAALYGSDGANGVVIITTKKAAEELNNIKARKNLDETAFFFPHLTTDKNGKFSFTFTSPEALTRWKLRLLAHSKKAAIGYYENTIVTQKQLMISPNFPRFFREKDTIFINAKISNLTAESKNGTAVLQLFDAVTMEAIDIPLANTNVYKPFTITPGGNTVVNWKLIIPEGIQAVQYKVLAKSGTFSDGEENIIPVVTNSMLVTESIPLWVREGSTKQYSFENLKNNTSPTLRNHLLTLEYTSNPTWLAIQSLPYLMEYEHECAEQTFARFYGNVLATTIINSNPKIATLFETWRKNGELSSKLEQNEELKSVLLAETPWLLDAKSEEEKKKNLALLLDLDKMKTSLKETFRKLKNKQASDGGFSWFEGMTRNAYITNHIMAGLGHLEKMKVAPEITSDFEMISETAIPFMDSHFMENHRKRTEKDTKNKKLIWPSPYDELHYLYARSFYLEDYPLSTPVKNTIALYIENCMKNWLTYSLYEKGMAALTLHRFGETKTAKEILLHCKETASNNEDWGMYWIQNKAGWYWYQAPVETQALLIEAFAEIENDTKSVDAMKVWLLKNRQNTNWPSTKATTEAVYALLLQGTDWLSVKDNTVFKIGNEKIATKKLAETEKEAETGYLKLNWKADEITKKMADITIENKSKVPGYGGYFWQYFEDLDHIKTFKGGVMSVQKELYLNRNTDNGKQLQRITSENPLKIGDLVTVRLVIKTTEDMEYVHLKDMRAAGFEPVAVLSQYDWKNGLSYYQSTKDLATHFFFDRINKGTYVLEYDIRVNNKGDFSNGITTIQSMYAPEFTSHTKGIRVSVKE